MTQTWQSDDPPKPVALTAGGWLRAGLRGVPLLLVLFAGLALMLVIRLAERPLCGSSRPWTAWITVAVCRLALRIMGLRRDVHGKPMITPGALVANHSSWLDIFALNASGPMYFVAKSEVAAWPGIGWLARATGTIFVRRDRREAGTQKTVFEDRLKARHRICFFPEGTSTDGQRVLAFKPTLFAAMFSDALRDQLWVQPVTLVYHAPDDADPRYYGWWGDMEFGPHLLQLLGSARQGRVEVTWHAPIRVSEMADRKAMARVAEAAVRHSHPHGQLGTA